jgi:hypothetical protein
MSATCEPAARRRSALVGGLVGCLLGLGGLVGAPPARAEPVGWVEGTVRAQGEPVANAWVSIMPVTPTGGWAGTPVQTTTDQDGRYRVAGLPTPHVKVNVRAPALSGLASSYWPDDYAFATAGILPVAPSGSTADVDLPAGASISGRVVDADTGAPITGAQVQAHVEAPPGWEAVGRTGLAAGTGQFVIDDLPPVGVALQVRAREGTNHLGQWYDAAGFHGAATAVRPGATDLVIRLRAGAEVGGAVRDDGGRSVADATVTIIGCPSLCPMSARTDSSGAYRIRGVPPGVGLRAYVEPATEGLLDRWYSAPGQTGDTSFDLTAGQVRGDLDVILTAGALVVGRAVDQQTGQPIAGVTFELVDVDNPLRSHLSRAVRPSGSPPAPDAPGAALEPWASPAPIPSAQPSQGVSGGSDVVVGPVPPGRYALVVHPGSRNRDYLPVELVGGTGIDGTGQVQLAGGERARITVTLARQRTATPAGTVEAGGPVRAGMGRGTDAPVGRSGPVASAGWPGLFRGFLTSGGSGFLRLGS